ncbi:MAG: integrase [Bacteroidetes bacterium]|nr:MAG: integrase [Bacteroidota bacterium]
MIESAKKIKLVPVHYQEKLAHLKSRKYRLLALLMLDCGLRVSEACQLQFKCWDFYRKTLTVRTLKRRDEVYREIPLTDRVLDAAAEWFERVPNRNPDAYCFPSGKGAKKPYADRKQVWRRLKAHTDGVVNPHALRHTFATRIVNEGNELRVAQKLLGHKSITTTEIYTHVQLSEKRRAIASLERRSLPVRIWRKFFPKERPKIHILPVNRGLTKFHIGRKEELARLAYNGERKINTIILGPQGVGKSHLLENYSAGNIIRISELTALKKLFTGIILELCEREPQRAKLMFDTPNPPNEIVERKTVKALIEDMIALTHKGEYTIIIDDLTRITPTGINALEKLKNHFHILAAARRIDYNKRSFLTNFERIDLKPLPRPEATELIVKLSQPFIESIEDLEAYKNHIWENTQGNPLFIYEMVERYSKEQQVSNEVLQEVRHTAAAEEINFLPFLIGLLACMSVLRYWGRITGTDSGPWYFLAAIGVIFLFFGREMIRATRRKYV